MLLANILYGMGVKSSVNMHYCVHIMKRTNCGDSLSSVLEGGEVGVKMILIQ